MQLLIKRSYLNEPLPYSTYEVVTVWEEDDALTPDRERIDEAWKRIVGRELKDEPHPEWVDDRGDWIARLHRGGWVEIGSCDGAAIGVLVSVTVNG